MEITLLNADAMEISPFNICVKCSKLEQCNFMPIFVILNYHIYSFAISVLIFSSPDCLPQFRLIQILSPHIAEMSQRQARTCTRKQGG